MPLRVSTIAFLNPAPLLYNFEHEPTATALREHYDVHYTTPSICADELNSGAADLGLIPIASLTPNLAIVPGCAIASIDEVRSILLLVKNPDWLSPTEALKRVRTVATDTASRSSVAYARILFEHFHQTHPTYIDFPADPATMLPASDAALIIGDPALLAREHRTAIDNASKTPLLWLDLAHLWRELTGLPWVAAVWALRPESLRSRWPHATAINSRPNRQPRRRPRPHPTTSQRVDPETSPLLQHHSHLPPPQHPLHPGPRLPPRHRTLPHPVRQHQHPPTPPRAKHPNLNQLPLTPKPPSS